MRRRLFVSLFVLTMRGREVIYDLFPKFQIRHDGFYGLSESDEGDDTDLIYNKYMLALQWYFYSALLIKEATTSTVCSVSGIAISISITVM